MPHLVSSTTQPIIGYGEAFGTFGELLQGVLPENDRNFLVTLPIDRFTHATYQPDTSLSQVVVTPAHKHKSQRLAHLILDWFGLPAGGQLTLATNLPEGKGFASSSCDLVASARAIAHAFGLTITPALLERFMVQIEPTDGVMYDGIVVFYHREVRLGTFLGSLPPLTIIGGDEGGAVDTIAFNTIPKPFTTADKYEYLQLLNLAITAVRQQDLQTIGQVATRSALLNQKLRPKRKLQAMHELCQELGGLGVVTAHSGTVLGILLSPEDPLYSYRCFQLMRQVEQLFGNATEYHLLNFHSQALQVGSRSAA